MNDTRLLKALAIILITNSHLDALYPIAALGFGGALGNSLFFTLSGLGLGLSAKNKGCPSFISWFFHRLKRIYPSVWLVVLLFPLLLLGNWQKWTIANYVSEFIYPTSYWFISAILVFYVLLFPLLKTKVKNAVLWTLLLCLIPYFYFYFTQMDLTRFSVEDKGYFKWIFYFQLMLWGLWLSSHYPFTSSEKQATHSAVFACLLFVLSLGFKWLLNQGLFLHWQFLTQWICFPFVFLALRAATHPRLQQLFETPVLGRILNFTGDATLEIYLLQVFIYTSPWVTRWAFPVNILVFTVLVLICAWGIQQINKRLPLFGEKLFS